MNPLEPFKEWMQDHLDELTEKFPDKKKELNTLYQQITIAYEAGINKQLAQGNAEAQALVAKLDSIQTEVAHDLEHMENIAGIVDKITTGVKIATKIAGFLI